jgi:Trypsin
MMCTFTPLKSPCYGDSGGPLIVPGNDSLADVQVGVVSWGAGRSTYNCNLVAGRHDSFQLICTLTHPIVQNVAVVSNVFLRPLPSSCWQILTHPLVLALYPGVYARVSSVWEWIRAIVCNNSDGPPEDFRCDEGNLTFFPESGTPSDTLNETMVSIVMVLRLGEYAQETGFRLESIDGMVIQELLPGSFVTANDTIRWSFRLEPEQEYQLVLLDSNDNGLFANVQIYLDNVAAEKKIANSGPKKRLFAYETTIPFRTSLFTAFETKARVYVKISSDNHPQETGWKIEDLNGNVEHETLFGAYLAPEQDYLTILMLPIDREFVFVVSDISGYVNPEQCSNFCRYCSHRG